VETAPRPALRQALSPRLRRRDGQAVLAVVVAVAVVAAVCCWPLARLHPLDGVWAAAVGAAFAGAAWLCADLGLGVVGWLLACALLWGVSAAGALGAAMVPAGACWAALWLLLAAAPVVAGAARRCGCPFADGPRRFPARLRTDGLTWVPPFPAADRVSGPRHRYA